MTALAPAVVLEDVMCHGEVQHMEAGQVLWFLDVKRRTDSGMVYWDVSSQEPAAVATGFFLTQSATLEPGKVTRVSICVQGTTEIKAQLRTSFRQGEMVFVHFASPCLHLYNFDAVLNTQESVKIYFCGYATAEIDKEKSTGSVLLSVRPLANRLS